MTSNGGNKLRLSICNHNVKIITYTVELQYTKTNKKPFKLQSEKKAVPLASHILQINSDRLNKMELV